MARLTVHRANLDNLNATIKVDYYKPATRCGWHYFGRATSTNPVYQALVPPRYARTLSAQATGPLQGFNNHAATGSRGNSRGISVGTR